MELSLELTLLIAAFLLVMSIISTRFSTKLGVPALVLFLVIGMLAGSDGLGGINFSDAALAQSVGVVALIFILFSGGLDTDWQLIRPVLLPGLVLANIGVLVSTVLIAAFAVLVFDFSWLVGLLLGAIISSTDAAAVFAVLRTRGVHLHQRLEPLIELESGSNDPMAVFLTAGLTGILVTPGATLGSLVPSFVIQMVVGAAGGVLLGRLMVELLNRSRLQQEGLYVVFTLGYVVLIYTATTLVGGNGFLAVYVAGIVLGNHAVIHKRSIIRFHEGIAWLMQISMFLTLGLLVFPSQLVPVMGEGLAIALFLILVARPLSVVLALVWFRFPIRDCVMVGWAGLRGAVPIILATFPLLAGVPEAPLIFNMVFFAVVVSVLMQGTSIDRVAQWLGVKAERSLPSSTMHEFIPDVRLSSRLREIVIPAESSLVNQAIIDLALPRGALIVQIQREDETLIPSGATVLEAGDHLLILATPQVMPHLEALCRDANALIFTPDSVAQGQISRSVKQPKTS